MNTLLVSIIVNNYNYAQYLCEAIDSACAQSYDNTEVIVVDDGSTDNSLELIAKYDDAIIIVSKENGGQASAFNAGFSASRGDIIIFLDADDYLLPNAVERIVAVWPPDGVAKVHALLNGIDAQGQFLGYTYPARGEYLGNGHVVTQLLERGVYGVAPTSGNAFSRGALEKIFPIDEEQYRISADGYLAVTIAFYGDILALEEPIGAYRVHGSNNWGTSMEGRQFRAFIEHDIRKQKLIAEQAENFGYNSPPDLMRRTNTHLRARIASLKLDPESHPIETDSLPRLIYDGVRSTWLYAELTWQKRSIVTLWFFMVGLLPTSLAKPVINWLFAQQNRPQSVERLLSILRPIINQKRAKRA
ncbi:MAG: glycosyltransferase [Cyanobacteria bacterium P01_F01_bin.33]